MKELIEIFPSRTNILSLSERELDRLILNIVTARSDSDGLKLPKYLSIGELENVYGVGLSLSSLQLNHINESLIASYQRLLSANLLMPAPGQPSGVVTVSPQGRRGLQPERRPEDKPLLDWAGASRVTLAVVFTDIVDSTVLGLELGDAAMGELQRKHFTRSKELLAQTAGRQIKTIGDSVMAVFRSVGAAFDYARALQRDPGASELQVRAGIHTGPVDVIGEDIAGSEVALAKRIVDAIDGAEIWLSDRAKDDIDSAGTHRLKGWQWQPHEVDLKSFGHAQLWSLAIDCHRDGRRAAVERDQRAEPALKISSGEDGPYLQTHTHSIYSTIRTLKLKIDNTSASQAITGVRVSILSIEPQSEYKGPWTLAENLILAAGDHCFIPLASFQEARNAAGYSTTRFERSATFFEILSTHTQPKPSRDVPQFVTVRATGIGSAPRDYQCKIWVDRPDGRLRVADAVGSDAASSATETTSPRRFTDRTPEHLLAFYVGQTALQADKSVGPFKGMWIKTEGVVTFLAADGKGAVCVLRRGALACGRAVECHFSENWVMALGRYDNGETLKVIGKIAPWQNGSQLHLLDCELSDD